MKNKRIAVVLLCAIIVQAGCGRQETKEDIELVTVLEEPVIQEKEMQNEGLSSGPASSWEESKESAGVGPVAMEMGPENLRGKEGELVITLHDFQMYDTPKAAGVSLDKLYTIDAQYYADRSKFFLVQADIQNTDYPGDEGDGRMNVSFLTIVPAKEEEKEAMEWEGSLPVYLSEPGTGETDFYYVEIPKGETKTVALGYYVPVKDIEELCSRCIISISGSYDEGYTFELGLSKEQ